LGKRREQTLREAQEHHAAGRLELAARSYQSFLSDEPLHVDALLALSDVLESLGRNAEAIAGLELAVQSLPFEARLHGRLADALQIQGEIKRAIASYHEAISIEPQEPGAWWGLGCAQAALGDHAGAVQSFQRLVELQPENGLAEHNLGKSLFELGQVDRAIDAFRQSVDHLPADLVGLPLLNIAVAIPGSAKADHAAILEARRSWAVRCLPPPAADNADRQWDRGSDTPPRIRLGYVSAFLDKRNWMKPVWGLINRHDRQRFEIHLFSDVAQSVVESGLRIDPRDHFHETSRLDNRKLARRIEELQIDILIDLNGYSRPSRLPLFTLRPSPVQIAWFNMFATSGMSGFDVIIGDDHVVLADEEPYFTERVVRVPGSYLTFEVNYPVPDVAPAPCLRRPAISFGCLAPQYKVTVDVVEAWACILRQCPGTRLLLKNVVLGEPSARAFVLDLFARFSVSPEQLMLEGPAEHYAFLERYADIDIALDTFPYNGGTTTMEALWQGVPVLTFWGDRWASRISASLLREAGLGDYVTESVEEYIARAIALARDPSTPLRLQTLREQARRRLGRSPACDVTALSRHMESLLLDLLAGGKSPHAWAL